jgi:glucokinase
MIGIPSAMPITADAETDGGVRTAIGLDVGGTKIGAAVVTDRGRILESQQVPTPPQADADTTVSVLTGLVRRLVAQHPAVEAIGAGAPGMVRWPDGYIRWAPNNAYRHLALKDRLATATGLPVAVDNDANAAAWAETCFGRGRGHRNVVALTVGTGIGGGVIINGELYRGCTGFGAEVGHNLVNPSGGHRCGCGAIGCLEAEASGTALQRMGREVAAREPAGTIARLADGGDITGEIIFRAVNEGDPAARDLFERLGWWLGVGVASLVNIFEPEIVIIGGGLAATGDALLAPTRASYRQSAFARDLRELPPVAPAALGPEAGVVGAAALALTVAALPQAAAPPASPRRGARMTDPIAPP